MADLRTLGDEPRTDAGPAGPAPGPAPGPPARVRPGRTGRSRWAVSMAALAVVALLLATLDVVLLVAGDDPAARQRGPALAVARQVVLELSRSGPEGRDEWPAALREATTGPLRDEPTTVAELLRGAPGRDGAVAAEIGASALERIDDAAAVALVTVTVEPAGGPATHHRLVVELRRTEGTWKAESVQVVP
ncbi:hypothetical protein [Pseudonocardia sp.]|uniref:hypothetical protein n=1 Tax=Pseudonocardia sp. TaxID=60912 RepID=UPI003D140D74